MGEPFDQGNIGSCVAQAVAKALWCSHAQQTATPQPASRLAIYYLARATHHMQHFDTGTYIRAAFQILNTFGFAPELEWPYQTHDFAKMPPTRLFQRAIDQTKGARYHRIFESGDARCDAVKLALSHGHSVVFGTDVDDAFTAYDFDHTWDGPTTAINGGHAMAWGSYNAIGPEAINSWGSWSKDGWARFTWGAVKNHCRDLWVVQHAPTYA